MPTPDPHDVHVILLMTCTRCGGQGWYLDEDEDLCNCPRCEDGRQLTALSLSTVLSIFRPPQSVADAYDLLAEAVRKQGSLGHSALQHLPSFIPEKVRADHRKKRPHSALPPAPGARILGSE